MNLTDFCIGEAFTTENSAVWTCTDIGSRFVVATPGLADPGNLHAGDIQVVFSAADLTACSVYSETLPYELDFQRNVTNLVMSHIDRMNDVCVEDNALRIISSFTEGFSPLFESYMALKFPQRAASLAKR